MSLVVAAGSGDHRAQLEALRDLLASSLVEAKAEKRAPLAAQFRAVLAELAGLPVGVEVSAVDEIAARRSARLGVSDPEPVVGPVEGVVRRRRGGGPGSKRRAGS